MSSTPSRMIPLGTIAPKFELTDGLSSTKKNLNTLKGSSGTLIVFICNHCPYVIHLLKHWVNYSNELLKKKINTIAISSNDVQNYPEDNPKLMKKLSLKYNFKFPYLYDHNQEVAKKYDAACTPDFYLFDKNNSLFYRGRYDKSRPNNSEILDGLDLKNAVELMINNKKLQTTQYPSLGCNIKWKKGNEPDCFSS